ncbi:hypothetical protein F4824DRAFT_507170 [Ustulina deusta]|nr:hypothetical protein F4823DRAFT_579514 [Ustulina deusta]KAI3343318.1 hypothetical protein F4824DRAFT_507170 [Ustulina deusta]
MHSTKVLLAISALAGTSLSQKSDSEYCSAVVGTLLSSLIAQAPTTPAVILSYVATQTAYPSVPPFMTGSFESHASQLCAIAEQLPSSLLPTFQSFASNLLAVGKSYEPELIAYITDCSPENEVASMTSALESYFTPTGNPCPQTATPTGSSNGTYSTSIVTAAAARPTGVLLGVAALGGAAGAAAML